MKLWPFARKSVTATADLYKALIGRLRVKSGAVVNNSTALEVSVVFRCVSLLADGLAMVPFKVYQAINDTINPATNHEIYWLISKKPNEWQTSYEFRHMVGMHLALCQEAFVFINRSVTGKILELIPYSPTVVAKVKGTEQLSLSYKIRLQNGTQIEVLAQNMWHIRGMTLDGVTAIETVKAAREAIGLSLATEEHSARMFSNGARVGGVLSTEGELSEQQVKDLRDSWEQTQGGSENAFKTAVLYGGLKWNASGFNSEQAQLIESRRNQVEEICRFFGVLPIMVGFADKTATYASAEAMFTAHVMYTLLPFYRRFEDSADVWLLGMDAVKNGFYTKLNASGLLRGSIKDRGDFYVKMYNVGAYNSNDIRAFEEMNPYKGGEKYRVPLNMVDPSLETPKEETGATE